MRKWSAAISQSYALFGGFMEHCASRDDVVDAATDAVKGIRHQGAAKPANSFAARFADFGQPSTPQLRPLRSSKSWPISVCRYQIASIRDIGLRHELATLAT